MNKKNWLCAVVAAVGLLAVGAAGHSLGKPATVNASAGETDDGKTWGIIGSFPNNNWSSDYATSSATDTTNGTKTLIVNIPEGTEFKIRANTTFDSNSLGGSVLTQSRTGGDTYFEISSTNDNAKVKTGYSGQYTFVLSCALYGYGDKSFGVTVSYVAPTQFTISEYKVVDGTLNTTLIGSEKASAGYAFTPTDQHIAGANFGGWFTNETCTTAYTATTWTAVGNLYAKYTTLTTYSYTYFQLKDWTNVYIYTFGQSEVMGAWPGTKVVSGTNGQYDTVETNFQTNGGIAKCAYLTGSGDTKVIFSDGTTTNKTADLDLTDKAYYTHTSTAGDASLGIAAEWICEAEPVLEAATNQSSCAISKADATTLWNSYSAITDTTAKAAINSATVYTWVDASRATNTDVTYEAIANRLYGLSTGSSGVYSPFLNPEAKQSSWVLFASIAAAAMAGAIIFYTLRKRKHE
jgi:hypothetical protein